MNVSGYPSSTLPLHPTSSCRNAGSPGGPRILLVDDEPLVARIVADFLSPAASYLGRVSSGREALEAFEGKSFELLVTDQVMPGMDGISLAQKLKRTHPHLKVILISGIRPRLSPSLENGRSAVDRFLAKPFTQNELLEAVDTLLGTPQAT